MNTGDQDISGIAINATDIATNATDIDALEAEQIVQNDAIAINTAKTGITTAQADIIANTSGINTGDQDISGITINATDIATNATDIDALEAEQIVQNDAIAINTAKTGISTAQADIIANTSGVNTGDQDISGIAVNATDIDALEAEQIVQNDAIAINTAKTGITTAQADIIANTSGVNTGDQDISGIAVNATDIDALEAEQVTQNDAIAINTAKTGITTTQADIIANTSGINTGDQDISGIAINATNIATNTTDIDALEAEQVTQNDAIAINTAKTGITTAQADIIANTSGINTGDQDISGIAVNATDIDALEAEQIVQNDAIAINTAKTGITTAQADIIANTSGVNTGDQDISGIAVNATDIATNTTDINALEAEQVTQNDAIAINTAKTGITTAQADIIANTSGVNTGDQDISGIAINATDIDALEAEQIVQNDAIAINTAKTGITTAQADIIANTTGVNTGDQDISGIAVNATNIATNTTDIDALEAEQVTQNDAIAINTAKTGITTAQADIIANTSGVNTGDQDISGIAINATDIDALEAEQVTQNDAIAINTAKTGITTAQADIIANTSGINTGDQDISGIAVNATDIDALEAEQIVQNDAIAINTAKTGITTAQADIIANTSGINTGDQDISGITVNATDIDALEAEQIVQNDAIAINTAKTGITTAQADIIANTSGINTGDQDISGIAVNATDIATNTTDIDALEAEQVRRTTPSPSTPQKRGLPRHRRTSSRTLPASTPVTRIFRELQ